jgi:hypothetical protein
MERQSMCLEVLNVSILPFHQLGLKLNFATVE